MKLSVPLVCAAVLLLLFFVSSFAEDGATDDLARVKTRPKIPLAYSDETLANFVTAGEACAKAPGPCIDNNLELASSPLEESPEIKELNRKRRMAVKEEFMHAWNGFVRQAWGGDEQLPVSGEVEFSFGGTGATPIAALDTMMIMGLKDPIDLVNSYIKNITFENKRYFVNLARFQSQIVGGLISAYELSGDSFYLQRAQDALSRVIVGYEGTFSFYFLRHALLERTPKTSVNLQSQATDREDRQHYLGAITLNQVTAGLLELTRLSQLTSDEKTKRVAHKLLSLLAGLATESAQVYDGLHSLNVDTDGSMPIKFSFVNYGKDGMKFLQSMLKQSLLSKAADSQAQYTHFVQTVNAIAKHMLLFIPDKQIVTLSEKGYPYRSYPKVDVETCGLAALLGLDGIPPHVDAAKHILSGCLRMGETFSAKFQPQSLLINFADNTQFEAFKAYTFEFGPEIFESLFVLYRVTGDEAYRDAGWNVFVNMVERGRRANGYGSIRDVTYPKIAGVDYSANLTPAHLYSGAFKYLYLLFAPRDYVPLKDYVFNTEGHVFKRS